MYCSGKYPIYLWLFKDILEEVRLQLVFQDHLLDHVTRWKNQISDGRTKYQKGKPDIRVCNSNQSVSSLTIVGVGVTWDEYSIVKARCRLGKSLTMSLNWKRKKLVSCSEKIHC